MNNTIDNDKRDKQDFLKQWSVEHRQSVQVEIGLV